MRPTRDYHQGSMMYFLPSGDPRMEYHRKLGETIEVSSPNVLLRHWKLCRSSRGLFTIWDGSSFCVLYMVMLCADIPLVFAITILLKVTSVLYIKNPHTLNCALLIPVTKSPLSNTCTDVRSGL